MISDATLLKLLMMGKEQAQSFKPHIKLYSLTEEGRIVYKAIFEYYNEMGVDFIDVGRFATWFHQVKHPEFNEDKHALYNEFFKVIENEDVDESSAYYSSVVQHYQKEALKYKLQKATEDEECTVASLKRAIQSYELAIQKATDNDYAPNDFKSVVHKAERGDGLRWRLTMLNKAFGPIIQGDFGLVAAFTNIGKTTFLASEVGFMAQQIKDGHVLWFNNEGPDDRVQEQIYEAVLEKTAEQIAADPETAQREYTEKMNGDVDRIMVFNAAGFTVDDVRTRAEKHNAKLIILDITDHFVSEGKHARRSDTEVIRLKNLYMDLRQVCKEFCPMIGTSQTDGTTVWKDRETQEIKYQEYIGEHQLEGSRLAKQSATEFLITIGRNANYPLTRSIYVARNKLRSPHIKDIDRNIKGRVNFNGAKSLYTDPTY